MLGQQRFTQKPSDRWFDQEERDPEFNIMSPTGRNRPFKGIHMPRNGHWEGPQTIIGNSMSNGWSRSEGMFGVHAPQSVDGIPYVYHRGPAGQTPFPTLIAMSGYFPQGTQSTSQQQQQQQHPYGPTPPPPQSNAGPRRSISNHQISQHHPLQLQQMPYPSPPALMNEDDKGLDFWRRASPQLSTSATVVDGSGK